MIQKIAKLFRETWLFWVYSICYGFLIGRETDAAPIPPRVEIVFGLLFGFLLATWVAADARRKKQSMGYGFPSLVFVLWPIFAPIYLFQTRGVRAFLSIFLFVVTMLITNYIGECIGLMTAGAGEATTNR